MFSHKLSPLDNQSASQDGSRVHASGGRADLVPSLAGAYAKAGQREEALQALEQLKKTFGQRRDMSLPIARLLAALGDHKQSCAWLEKSDQAREGGLILLNPLPEGEPLRSDPCINRLVRRIGLAP